MSQLRKIFVLHLMVWSSVIFFLPDLAAQSAWTQKKGDFFAKAYVNYGRSDKFFTLPGNELETTNFTQVTYGLYGEYGITDRLTLLVDGPIVRSQSFESTETITAIGDLPIGVKYGILQKKFPVSVSFVADIPIAKANNFAQNLDGLGEINLPAGDGEWNFLTTLAASHSFKTFELPTYLSLYATYNYRTEFEGLDLNDQIRFGISGGIQILNRFWLNAALRAQETFGSVTETDFVRGQGTTYTSYQVGALIPVYKQWMIDFSYSNFADFIIQRKNLYSAGVFSIGLVFERKR